MFIQDVTNTRSICRKVRIQQRAIFMGTCVWMGKGKGMGREHGYGTLSSWMERRSAALLLRAAASPS